MEAEVDINILVNTLVQKIAMLHKENAFLEAKYQTLIKEHNEAIAIKNELQQELDSKNQ
ncbi:hypothetical protein [Synechococcus phage DSL-LC03]|nr:hypothetical protein [Synechococcus phage DSL-LC03]